MEVPTGDLNSRPVSERLTGRNNATENEKKLLAIHKHTNSKQKASILYLE